MKQMLLFEFVETETNNNAEPVVFKKLRLEDQTPQTTESAPPVNTDIKTDPIIEPEDKTQASVIPLEPTTITAPSSPEAVPDVKQFPVIDENDPNKPLWDEIESGNFDRNSIIERYNTLGETAVIENDRGLIDSHRRRAANLGQFFTSALIVEFITRLLKLDSTDLNPIIIDNSCGAGGMFRYLSPTCRIAGIELEENAFRMAKALYPEANIINDDLSNHTELDNKVDFCLINPPFSIQIEKKNMRLENAGWGKLGPSSSILSHIAAMEVAIRAARGYVAAVVPTSFFENESTLTFERWIKDHATKVMRIDLPAEAFKENGTEWHCSVVIYRLVRFYSRNRTDSELIHLKINSMSELDNAITTWRLSGHETDLNQYFDNILKQYPLDDLVLQKYEEETESTIDFKPLPITERDCARIVLSKDASHIRIKPNGLLAALKTQEIMDGFGEAYNNATKTNVQEFKMYTRRANIIENPDRIYELKKKAEGLGIETVIDPQILNWLRNKKKWLKRQMTPFEQWIYQESMEQAVKNPSLGDVLIAVNDVDNHTLKITANKEYIVTESRYRDALEITDDSGNTRLLEYLDMNNFILKDYEPGKLVELNAENGIRTAYATLYKQQIKQLEKLGIDWLYPFQKDDVARMSLKDSNLLCFEMGLGKSRTIIALGLLYGCRHNLIVVEARLKDSFIKEFKELKIIDYKVIEDEKDLRNLKKFNIISYNKLWRPLNNKTKKTFGKALRRRFGYIAIDEGHGIKAQGSKQALAVRCLKARYKLISTGTPIANYPRNIFSLLTFGWGDGTELNGYGYYTPTRRPHGGYTSGTRQFKEDFVTIEWVTPQFEQTLDKGRKSREMPKIKDIRKWHAMLAPKMIRRTRDEPDVIKSIKIPDAKIEEIIIKPDAAQVAHYKKWLDEFANWFKQQLELEKEGGHKIDQMIILAHLTKLQFASTIPQSPSTNFTGFEWTGALTTKQAKTLELIKEAIANKEKIIVYSERPEFQKFIQTELKKINIASHVFIGEQGIEDRNDLLDDFKNNGTDVLLATTTCGGTGLNIPEANVVVIADTSWTPARQIQAYSRILRPQQKKQPRITLLRCNGTIDMYMRQLMSAKSNAINQGIDYSEYEEIDLKKWLSYRDFTIKMLKDEGYDID
ncbi:MAG: SNF2-related protein (plasmid) [Candidatus Methanoperedens sp.]|nr:MAG: SNF2-related protein [Candidatus Methanoperedens sp.]